MCNLVTLDPPLALLFTAWKALLWNGMARPAATSRWTLVLTKISLDFVWYLQKLFGIFKIFILHLSNHFWHIVTFVDWFFLLLYIGGQFSKSVMIKKQIFAINFELLHINYIFNSLKLLVGAVLEMTFLYFITIPFCFLPLIFPLETSLAFWILFHFS